MRILEVFREPFAFGGQESYIMNMYRAMDHEKIVMDFFTPFTADNKAYMEEIKSFGGQVFSAGHPFGQADNQNFKNSLTEFLKDHAGDYDAMHVHSGSSYALMEGAKLAKAFGIPYRIVHSHSCGFENWKHRLVKAASASALKRYPTHHAACSLLAGEWKYPKEITQGPLRIFKNAVDLDIFHFDARRREEIRQREEVDGKIVLGHVGRFSTQKNHSFLIDLFARFHQIHPDSVLWLVGIGELQEQIRQKVEQVSLSDSVRFFNLRQDVADLYQAMDVFVLPSFFEGLPMVGIEAQATGLPVVTSDLVARELPAKDLAYYLSLDSFEPWIAQIESLLQEKRQDQREVFVETGYEVNAAARILQDFYLSLDKSE